MLVEVELRGFDHHLKEIKEHHKVGFEYEGIREVYVPDDENVVEKSDFLVDKECRNYVLELVWKYGQNDFQPKQQRSLMVGDIVRLYNRRFRVENEGFSEVK